jgi:hypothetical protein
LGTSDWVISIIGTRKQNGVEMAELKTKPSGEDIEQFLSGISDEKKRRDSIALVDMMRQITLAEPVVWASSMVGFGTYEYTYASGRKGTYFVVGFAPRKTDLTLYGLRGAAQHEELLSKLGKYKTGKGCLYIKRLEDIDLPTLRELIQQAYANKDKDGC